MGCARRNAAMFFSTHPDNRMAAEDLERRQQLEIDFWRDSPAERPESDSVDNVINKMRDADVFLDLVERYRSVFQGARSILELGAGQGWASCIVKRLFPSAHVTATDISEYAVASVGKWEQIYRTHLDAARACRSYELPASDHSLDLVFCFASAHHFVAHRRTLTEVARVLTSGGHALYLYEPSCRPYMYAAARRRANMKRPDVPEDVLVYDTIAGIAQEVGLACELDFYPSTRRRGRVETIYYALLRALPPLQHVLPCTVNYHFVRP
jgi:SAM-dependent methyltransferase